MEIKVRSISNEYREVEVLETGIHMTSNVMDKKECFALAQEFQEAIDELTEGWETKGG